MENINKESKGKKIASIILNVLFYLFIACLLIFAIASLNGKDNKMPNIFGYNYMSVQTDSMEGNKENSFKVGDLVIGKLAKDEDIENIKVGDVITFKDIKLPRTTNQINTHRVVAINKGTDGKVYYVLQGDKIPYQAELEAEKNKESSTKSYTWANRVYKEDGNSDSDQYIQTITKADIIAVYRSKISGAGKVMDYLQSKNGFLVCILLPTVVLLLVEGFFLVKNILVLNKEKMEEKLKVKEEEQAKNLEIEKEKIRQELLAELAKKEEENKAE